MILLDTNVISEALKLTPSPQVIGWLNANFAEAAISSVTIFELGAGLALLDTGRRKDALENTISRTIRRLGSRVKTPGPVADPRLSLAPNPPKAGGPSDRRHRLGLWPRTRHA